MKYVLCLLLAIGCAACSNDKEDQDIHFGPGPEDEENAFNCE